MNFIIRGFEKSIYRNNIRNNAIIGFIISKPEKIYAL